MSRALTQMRKTTPVMVAVLSVVGEHAPATDWGVAADAQGVGEERLGANLHPRCLLL
jgi:hypothetical protein